VKRKRGNQEECRLTQVAGLGLAGDPSCMDIRTTEDGILFFSPRVTVVPGFHSVIRLAACDASAKLCYLKEHGIGACG
jgi:hypothetical protein